MVSSRRSSSTGSTAGPVVCRLGLLWLSIGGWSGKCTATRSTTARWQIRGSQRPPIRVWYWLTRSVSQDMAAGSEAEQGGVIGVLRGEKLQCAVAWRGKRSATRWLNRADWRYCCGRSAAAASLPTAPELAVRAPVPWQVEGGCQGQPEATGQLDVRVVGLKTTLRCLHEISFCVRSGAEGQLKELNLGLETGAY